MSCNDIRFAEGGVLQNCKLFGGGINSMTVDNCTVNSSLITNLRDIDDCSLEKIVRALSHLPCEILAPLANRLAGCSCPCTPPAPPVMPAPPTVPVIIDTGDDEGDGEGESGDGSDASGG